MEHYKDQQEAEQEAKVDKVDKAYAIKLAKRFKLTAYDIECSEYKALQLDTDKIDELHFDECAKFHAEIAELNNKLKMKKVN